jgi:uncharacterized protein YjbI with pentapeptide repeats
MRMNKGDRSEPWARKQRDAGLPVSFPADWSDEDRSVSGEFVLELLLDLESVDIVLANAIVVTPVEHRYARITGELRFDNCRFEKQVSLPLANFERRARFRGCVFNGDLDLTACAISYLWFDAGEDGVITTFAGAVQLLEARISGQLIARNARFTAPDKVASFHSIKVLGAVFLDGAEFAGPIDLSRSKIGGVLDLRGSIFSGAASLVGSEIGGDIKCDGAKFQAPLAAINFESARIGGHAIFRGAVFHGPVYFNLAQLSGSLDCANAKFVNEEQLTSFNAVVIGKYASFLNVEFQGPVNFGSAEFQGTLICDGASFRNVKAPARFDDLRVKGHAQFDRTTFSGGADFTTAMFAATLLFRKAEFLNDEAIVDLYGVKVGTYAVCEEAIFKGPVSLAAVEIRGDLRCDKAQFLDPKGLVNFDRLRVTGDAYFREAIFQGPVAFTAAEIEGLINCFGTQFLGKEQISFNTAKFAKVAIFQDATFGGSTVFANAEIGGYLDFTGVKFLDEGSAANFTGLKVGKDATFVGAEFHGGADFFGGELAATVRFDKAVFGKNTRFTGMTIAGRGIFSNAIFKGDADFSIVNVAGWLLFNFATFESKAIFSLARVGGVLEFLGTIFKATVDFNSAIVSGSLTFSPGVITDKETKPTEIADTFNFRGSVVSGDLDFRQTRFQGAAVFSQARVGGDANFAEALFKGSADFRSVDIGRDLYFIDATFSATASFRFAHFASDMDFSRVQFRDAVDFTGIRLTGTGYFSGTAFKKAVQFRDGAVEGDLRFESSVNGLSDKNRPAVFEASMDGDGLAVRGELVLADCTFAAETEFLLRGATLGYLNCSNTTFGILECFSAQMSGGLIFTRNVVAGDAGFSCIKVTGRALFNGTVFKKACDMREVALLGLTTFNVGRISGGGVPGTPCTFEDVVSFDKARVGGAIEFFETIFRNRASFVGAQFLDEVSFRRANTVQGQPPPQKLLFNGIADFTHAEFFREVRFIGVQFKNAARFSKCLFHSRVGFSEIEFCDSSDNSAIFAEANFESQAAFSDCVIAGRLAFYGAKSRHTLLLATSCQFNGLIDFENAQLSFLKIISDKTVPENFAFLGRLRLDGCTYQRIVCGDPGLSSLWITIRNSLEPKGGTQALSGDFERQPYLQFERFCREVGNSQLADTVYYDLRQIEGRLEQRRIFWLWNWVERLAFGYGVRPVRMFVVFLLALLGGALVADWSMLSTGSWQNSMQSLAISFAYLVPGVDKLVKTPSAQNTGGTLDVTVAIAQYCLGWALLALLAHRFFKGLKR